MSKNSFLTIFIGILLSSISLGLQAQVDALSKKLLQAHEAGKAIPNLSSDATIDMSSAYQIQTAYVKGRLAKDEIAGFKAGLTNYGSQTLYGINRPIFGILFKSGNFSAKPEFSLTKFNALMVETELGFITKKPIRQSVPSTGALKAYIERVVPVIELPNVNFASMPMNAVELVAANACSTGYIIHPDVNWYGEDINEVTVSLLHNDIIISQGQGFDALGDQWEALRWLVNQVLAQGWRIEKGSLLITGALGEIVYARPGLYRAQFNDNAVIEFKVNT
ncbi:MAG: hypothetical protein JSS07_04660 [Proteobacteria bacterium]|nr:hypothetical protein [Pseudomonadota bacterium]